MYLEARVHNEAIVAYSDEVFYDTVGKSEIMNCIETHDNAAECRKGYENIFADLKWWTVNEEGFVNVTLEGLGHPILEVMLQEDNLSYTRCEFMIKENLETLSQFMLA